MDSKSIIKKNIKITPLRIIALFVVLTETVITIGVIQTSGGIQVALTFFAILFPILVSTAFFLILWNHPFVLYAPDDFGGEVDVIRFAEALQMSKKIDDEILRIQNEKQEVLIKFVSDEIYGTILNSMKSFIISQNENYENIEMIIKYLEQLSRDSLNSEIKFSEVMRSIFEEFQEKEMRIGTERAKRFDKLNNILREFIDLSKKRTLQSEDEIKNLISKENQSSIEQDVKIQKLNRQLQELLEKREGIDLLLRKKVVGNKPDF